jgi:hypothetical protein
MIRIFKSKLFARWAEKEGLSDTSLAAAIAEIEQGLIDADLGGHVIKKRVAIEGHGKSTGYRSLLAYKTKTKAFFIYGFAKNHRANVKPDELKVLKRMAKELLSYSNEEIKSALQQGVLIEVKNDE